MKQSLMKQILMKKKLIKSLLLIIFVLIPSILFSAVNLSNAIIATTLNTSTYVAITNGQQVGYGYSVIMSDLSGWYYATDSEGSDGVLMPEGISIGFTDLIQKGDTVFYAKGTTTGKLLLFPNKKVKY